MSISIERALEDHAPLYIPAGILKLPAEAAEIIGSPVVAAAIFGGYTENEHAGNSQGGKKQVFYWDEQAQAAYNSIGLENVGLTAASEYLPDIFKRMHDYGQMAVLQVTTLLGENPLTVLPRLAERALELGADRVEVNGSCPNLDPAHPLLCSDVDATYSLIEALKHRLGTTRNIGYKVSALPAEIIKRYRTEHVFDFGFVDGINTRGSQPVPINTKTGRPFIDVNDGKAGMSGPIIHDLAIENLQYWTSNQDDQLDLFEYWSVGGVLNAQDASLRRSMGATLVGGAQRLYRATNKMSVLEQWV